MDKLDYRLRRRSLGLSQASLAKILGVNTRTIQRREAGERIPFEAELAIRELCRIEKEHPSESEVQTYLAREDSIFAGEVHHQAHLEGWYRR